MTFDLDMLLAQSWRALVSEMEVLVKIQKKNLILFLIQSKNISYVKKNVKNSIVLRRKRKGSLLAHAVLNFFS